MKNILSIFSISILATLLGSVELQFATFTKGKDITSDVSMKWEFEGDDVILFFEKKTAGHLWIGFGPSMNGADIYRIEKTAGGTDLTVQDCYVNGHVTPTCGETQSHTLEHKEATTDSLKVQIRRKKITGETASDLDVDLNVNKIIYSYTSNDVPEQHSTKYGVVQVDFSDATGGSFARSKWGDGSFMVHEHGMTIIWTIVCDVLIFVGKYLKKYKRWFDIHAWTFFALGICSAIFTTMAPHDRRRRMLMPRDLAEGEVQVIEFWAKGDLHKTTGGAGNIITFILIAQGLLLRFMIALENRYFFHFVSSIDLTWTKRIHTILGIAAWILTRIALFTGAGLHSRQFGSTLYFYILIETILAFIIFALFEVIYRLKRMNWEYPLAVRVTKKGDYSKILEKIRSKGKKISQIYGLIMSRIC